MAKRLAVVLILSGLACLPVGCRIEDGGKGYSKAEKWAVQIILLEPRDGVEMQLFGSMYGAISPKVFAYGGSPADMADCSRMFGQYNNRGERPTTWQLKTYIGDDFLERMLEEKPGNVVVIGGQCSRRADYIKACVQAGLNVLACGPMCVDSQGLAVLEQAFEVAEKKGLVIWQIRPERYETTRILQRHLMENKELFEPLLRGTVDRPELEIQSLCHFGGEPTGRVSGASCGGGTAIGAKAALVGELSRLAELVFWVVYPNEAVDFERDIDIKKVSLGPVRSSQRQEGFGCERAAIDARGTRGADANGLPGCAIAEVVYTVKGTHIRISVPCDANDVHRKRGQIEDSRFRAGWAEALIVGEEDEKSQSELYLRTAPSVPFRVIDKALRKSYDSAKHMYPEVEFPLENERLWHIRIPEQYRPCYAGRVTGAFEEFLGYLQQGRLPANEQAKLRASYKLAVKAAEFTGND